MYQDINKYIYSECTQDYWPTIKTLQAKSYNDAVDKLIEKYFTELDDDYIAGISEYDDLREYLNSNYTIALSDLEIIDEL